jgi:hypothetical protein
MAPDQPGAPPRALQRQYRLAQVAIVGFGGSIDLPQPPPSPRKQTTLWRIPNRDQDAETAHA